MQEADKHYKEIIQEPNYSQYSCSTVDRLYHLQLPKHVYHKNSTNKMYKQQDTFWNNVNRADYVDAT